MHLLGGLYRSNGGLPGNVEGQNGGVMFSRREDSTMSGQVMDYKEKVLKELVTFKSVYMGIFYDFFIAQIQLLLMSTGQQKSFLCENGPPKKLVGAQGTFLR